MARIPQYVQHQLASSRVGTPGVDNSGAMLANSALRTTGAIADGMQGATQLGLNMERQSLAAASQAQQGYINQIGQMAQTAFVGLKALGNAAQKQVKDYQQDIAVAKAEYHAKQFIRDRAEEVQGRFSNPDVDPAGAVDDFRKDLEPALDSYADKMGLKQKGSEKVYAEFLKAGLSKASEAEGPLASWSVSQGNERAKTDLLSVTETNANNASRYGTAGSYDKFNEMMNDYAELKTRFVNRFGSEGVKLWEKGREQAVKQYVVGRLGAAEGVVGQSNDVVADVNKSDAIVNEVKGMVNANNFPWLEATDIDLLQNRADSILKSHATIKDKAVALNHQGWRNKQYMQMADAYASNDEKFVRQTIDSLKSTLATYTKDQNPDYYDQKAAQELVGEIGKLGAHANQLGEIERQKLADAKALSKEEQDKRDKAEAAKLNSPEAYAARVTAEQIFQSIPKASDIEGSPKELSQINHALQALTQLRANGYDGPSDKPNKVLEGKIAHLKELSEFTQQKAQENLKDLQNKANKEVKDAWLDFQIPGRLKAFERVNATAPGNITLNGAVKNFAHDMNPTGSPAAAQFLNETFRDARRESIAAIQKATPNRPLESMDFASIDAQIAGKMLADPALKAKLKTLATAPKQKAAPKPKNGLVPPPPAVPLQIGTRDPLMEQLINQHEGIVTPPPSPYKRVTGD